VTKLQVLFLHHKSTNVVHKKYEYVKEGIDVELQLTIVCIERILARYDDELDMDSGRAE
jgi:hypothetical protein